MRLNSLHRWINSVRHRIRLRAVLLPSTFHARIIEFLFFARLRAERNFFWQGPRKKQGFWEETNSFRCLQRYGRSGFVYICTPHTTGPHNTGGGTNRSRDVELWRRLRQPRLIQIPHFGVPALKMSKLSKTMKIY